MSYAQTMDLAELDWSLIRSFLAVIDAGSLLSAAKSMGTHQPTLSRRIAELEMQLGTPLFERTGRGLVPTAAALKILESARRMNEAASAIEQALNRHKEQEHGSVRLSCSQVVASFLVPRILPHFLREHPGVQVEIVASNALSNLLRRDADIALRMVRPKQSSLRIRKLGQLQMGAYAAHSYLAEAGKPTQVQQLLSHRLIGLATDPSLVQALQSLGVAAEPHHFQTRTDDQVALIQLIRSGCGIGFLPSYVAQQSNDLVQLKLGGATMPKLDIWLAVHREIETSRPVRALFDFLAHSIPNEIAS